MDCDMQAFVEPERSPLQMDSHCHSAAMRSMKITRHEQCRKAKAYPAHLRHTELSSRKRLQVTMQLAKLIHRQDVGEGRHTDQLL